MSDMADILGQGSMVPWRPRNRVTAIFDPLSSRNFNNTRPKNVILVHFENFPSKIHL